MNQRHRRVRFMKKTRGQKISCYCPFKSNLLHNPGRKKHFVKAYHQTGLYSSMDILSKVIQIILKVIFKTFLGIKCNWVLTPEPCRSRFPKTVQKSLTSTITSFACDLFRIQMMIKTWKLRFRLCKKFRIYTKMFSSWWVGGGMNLSSTPRTLKWVHSDFVDFTRQK